MQPRCFSFDFHLEKKKLKGAMATFTKLLKWVGIIFGGFFVLIIVLAITLPSNDKEEGLDSDSLESERRELKAEIRRLKQERIKLAKERKAIVRQRKSTEALKEQPKPVALISKNENPKQKLIDKLTEELKAIPARLTHENLKRYKQLVKLDPTNEVFTAKLALYKGRLSEPMKVISIADGDTIILLTKDKKQLKVRLVGIDAPEMGQDYGRKSKLALGAIFKAAGGQTLLEPLGKDKYERTLGKLYLADGTYVNSEILAKGWAWHFTKYNSDKDLAASQKLAQKKKVGLWADEMKQMAPWEFRDRQRVAAEIKRDKERQQLRTTQAAKEKASSKEKIIKLTHWLNTGSNVRHNRGCRWFRNTKRGRMCSDHAGRGCGQCGG